MSSPNGLMRLPLTGLIGPSFADDCRRTSRRITPCYIAVVFRICPPHATPSKIFFFSLSTDKKLEFYDHFTSTAMAESIDVASNVNGKTNSTSFHLQSMDDEELFKVFNQFDANGDGKISSSELSQVRTRRRCCFIFILSDKFCVIASNS